MLLKENNLFSVRESVLSDPILVNGYLIIRAKKISRKDCNYLKKKINSQASMNSIQGFCLDYSRFQVIQVCTSRLSKCSDCGQWLNRESLTSSGLTLYPLTRWCYHLESLKFYEWFLLEIYNSLIHGWISCIWLNTQNPVINFKQMSIVLVV